MWPSDRTCSRDAEMRKRLCVNVADPEVLAHAVECPACRETLELAVWMRELAAVPLNAPALPDATYLWWKAQVLRRWDADRQAVVPLDVGEHVQVGIGLGGAVLLLVWLWRQLDPLAASSSVPSTLTAVMIISAMSLAVAGVVAARQLFARE